ncbi:MAG: DUF2505 family protein [Myxococcota bacterium]
MDFRLDHVVEKPPNRAFEILVSDVFQSETDRQVSLVKTLISEEEGPDGPVKRWRVLEESDKPDFAKKLVGSAFEYTLEQRVQHSLRRLSWRVTPPMMSDRVKAEGYEQIDAVVGDDLRSHRVIVGTIEVSAPFVGKKLAEYIGGQVRAGFERSMPFIASYIAEAE